MIKFVIITILPIVFLVLYLREQDKAKPEPKKKLAACFGLGMLGGLVGSLVAGIFDLFGIGSGYDSLFYGDVISGLVLGALFVTIVYLILWKHSEKNPDFDEFLDGPVYTVCIAFGYEFFCDASNLFTDEWEQVGFISIMVYVAIYAAAMVIGYYYSMARFGGVNLTSGYKFKMWGIPVLIIAGYNWLAYWSNVSVFGTVVMILASVALAYFTYQKNHRIIAELKARDAATEEGVTPMEQEAPMAKESPKETE